MYSVYTDITPMPPVTPNVIRTISHTNDRYSILKAQTIGPAYMQGTNPTEPVNYTGPHIPRLQ
jgi:hypothetical protein